ncbi:isoleucine--tRNA ligase ISM1 NDAI_0E03100 [Naumovozyma dairenensis CBS 421]|uniref:Isoleucine--tRNA ligase, mitochondrial n=1 Tax=Naumovozyma dairenensis (strain ATCC 10597 / BCRC 20456 / CBS 421 / NBRC 0211 / NRRL Y-12639) TaxID=1071378 RepID=G0WBK7_NAUDC|nr:hypothetical protein NDAI_0E03100 [Naumovozyma dairenensis CBS 421]CCD25127.1 hypothetical protein NDAI_0E03100 [Naumovozyma dairenensis CBS 421]
MLRLYPLFTKTILRNLSKHAYQKTLNLPKSKFPSHSNLQRTINELIPQCSQEQYKTQLSEFIDKVNQIDNDQDKLAFIKKNLFILHDGPPYANGDLHLGHAVNKILKDIIIRYQKSTGKYIFYKPGWDCHGLPIELKVLKNFSKDELQNVSPLKIRSLAKKHALKTIKDQKRQFEQFGIFTDWDDPYITLNKDYELNQLRIFHKMFKLGLIKRQNKPVFWGTETKTALAESELEYNKEHKSTSAYVQFPLSRKSQTLFLEKLGMTVGSMNSIDCLIWTTTPWTLFSNKAICFNKHFEYSLVTSSKSAENYNKPDLLIIETNLISQVYKQKEDYTILKTFSGEILENLHYTNPLLSNNLEYPLLHADHVTKEAGTGLVHTAPGHGADDYLLGIQNNLIIYSPIDHEGRYKLSELPDNVQQLLSDNESSSPIPVGRSVLDPRTTKLILNKLDELEMLFGCKELVHSYPYDWRSKKPVILRATPQWFLNLNKVKTLAMESLDKKGVEFFPERGKTRLLSFIKNRNEWCISRQRVWGVPIPAFYKISNPDELLMTEEIIEHVIKTIESNGIDRWFNESVPTEEWLPEKYQNIANEYKRGFDTMDVWFDSGSSWKVIEDFYKNTLKLNPAYRPKHLFDLCLEGSDQHRGWFQSLLLTNIAMTMKKVAPYSEVITHGFTLDENGIKMSKSIGNTISPKDVIEGNAKIDILPLGVDGLRYFVAYSNFTTDITIGPNVMKHVAEALKKIRISFKFMQGNLEKSEDFKLIPIDDLRPIDKFVLSNLNELLVNTKQLYEEYNFSKILTLLQHHLTNELSAVYFDISKDSLYSDSMTSKKRQSIQTVLFSILQVYCNILYPILPTLVQEVRNNIRKEWINNNNTAFIPWEGFQLSHNNSTHFQEKEMQILKKFQELMGSMTDPPIDSTQVCAILSTNNPKELPFTLEEISDLLQVAEVRICSSEIASMHDVPHSKILLNNGTELQLSLTKSSLHKCPRCWKQSSNEADTLCHRCKEAVNEQGNT